MCNQNRPIKSEWEEYYKTLECIRRSGITNMWGAAPYLADQCKINRDLANEVLLNWIHNYNELNKRYGWQG